MAYLLVEAEEEEEEMRYRSRKVLCPLLLSEAVHFQVRAEPKYVKAPLAAEQTE
jgi:hypothetical protein